MTVPQEPLRLGEQIQIRDGLVAGPITTDQISLPGVTTLEPEQLTGGFNLRSEKGFTRTALAIGVAVVLATGALVARDRAGNDDRDNSRGNGEESMPTGPGDGDESETTETTVFGPDSPNVDADLEPSFAVSDEELATGDYNCAPDNRPEQKPNQFDYSYEINFLNQKPEIANHKIDYRVAHPKMGMGQAAWDSLLANGKINPNTPTATEFVGDEAINKHLHQMWRFWPGASKSYINSTCVDSAGNAIPLRIPRNKPNIILGGKNADGTYRNGVDGVVIDEAGLAEWKAKAKNIARFSIEDLGVRDLGEGEEQYYMVVLTADGCDNDIRLQIPVPKIPVERPRKPGTTTTKPTRRTTTTVRRSTTSTTVRRGATTTTTTPGTTTSTVVVTGPTSTTTTTTTPGKLDDGKVADPNTTTTSTTQPTPSGEVRNDPNQQTPSTSTTTTTQKPNTTTTMAGGTTTTTQRGGEFDG